MLGKKKVCIVVLGDIGRSPRMQYHGLSFLKEKYSVRFVGYPGSQPISILRYNNNVKFQYLHQCPEFKQYLPILIAYIMKVLWQILTLFAALLLAGFPDYVLVQNPPGLPALGVCYIYCKLFRSKFIIDWHNYGYSLLALSIGPGHNLVKVCKNFEFYFGRRADGNICVTKGMRHNLMESHGINAITFYDYPPEFFKSPSLEEKHKLFLALGIKYEIFLKNCHSFETVFTKMTEKLEIILRNDRPALLVTSTSWTEDEDFSILLSALDEYDKSKEIEEIELPKLICAITGKGPLKEYFSNIILHKNWKHIQVITPWLEPEEYPLFLGSADLGVCLHKSSSGLDLPMKVVDMFGCAVPVCAINFPCLSELVKHGENGYIFNNEKELSMQIKNWFKKFPYESIKKKKIKENILQHYTHRWHENWKCNIQPLF